MHLAVIQHKHDSPIFIALLGKAGKIIARNVEQFIPTRNTNQDAEVFTDVCIKAPNIFVEKLWKAIISFGLPALVQDEGDGGSASERCKP